MAERLTLPHRALLKRILSSSYVDARKFRLIIRSVDSPKLRFVLHACGVPAAAYPNVGHQGNAMTETIATSILLLCSR